MFQISIKGIPFRDTVDTLKMCCVGLVYNFSFATAQYASLFYGSEWFSRVFRSIFPNKWLQPNLDTGFINCLLWFLITPSNFVNETGEWLSFGCNNFKEVSAHLWVCTAVSESVNKLGQVIELSKVFLSAAREKFIVICTLEFWNK